jgi:hypothetical protein
MEFYALQGSFSALSIFFTLKVLRNIALVGFLKLRIPDGQFLNKKDPWFSRKGKNLGDNS